MITREREEKREDFAAVWKAIGKTNENVNDLAKIVANLGGKFMGYTVAAVLLASVVAFLANKVM